MFFCTPQKVVNAEDATAPYNYLSSTLITTSILAMGSALIHICLSISLLPVGIKINRIEYLLHIDICSYY